MPHTFLGSRTLISSFLSASFCQSPWAFDIGECAPTLDKILKRWLMHQRVLEVPASLKLTFTVFSRLVSSLMALVEVAIFHADACKPR